MRVKEWTDRTPKSLSLSPHFKFIIFHGLSSVGFTDWGSSGTYSCLFGTHGSASLLPHGPRWLPVHQPFHLHFRQQEGEREEQGGPPLF